MQKLSSNKTDLVSSGLKYGLPIVGVGVAIFAIRKILKRNPDGTSTKVAPSLKETVIQKENLTISVSDAALYANTLYGAMLNFGTDEKNIFSVLDKIQTKDDMLLVIKAFGMKQYLWSGRAAILGQDFNLIGWLTKELSKRDLAKIKPKFDSWGIPLTGNA